MFEIDLSVTVALHTDQCSNDAFYNMKQTGFRHNFPKVNSLKKIAELLGNSFYVSI